MKKTFVSFLFIFTFLQSTHAQYVNTTGEYSIAIQTRILLVGIEEENADALNLYLDQPENIKAYKESIEGKNYALKKAVDSFWTFSKEVKYMSVKQAKKLMKAEKDKYAFLHYGEEWSGMSWLQNNNSLERKKYFAWTNKNDQLTYHLNARYAIENTKTISLVIDLPKTAVEVYLPCAQPSQGDLVYAMQEIQYILRYTRVPSHSANQLHSEAYERSGTLKNKTLLMDNRLLNSKIKPSEISTYYPYPYKLVPYDVIEQALKEKNQAYAVLTISRYDDTNSIHTITDAADGTIYYFKTAITFELGNNLGTYVTYYRPNGITSGQLADYAAGVK